MVFEVRIGDPMVYKFWSISLDHKSWAIWKSYKANQHAVHVLKVRNHSKIDLKDELTDDEVCPEVSPILKLMHQEKEEIFQRKNRLDSFRFWYKVWQ